MDNSILKLLTELSISSSEINNNTVENKDKEKTMDLEKLVKRAETLFSVSLFGKCLQVAEEALKLLPHFSNDDNTNSSETVSLRVRAVEMKGKALMGLGKFGESSIFLGREMKALKSYGGHAQFIHREQHWRYLQERVKVLSSQSLRGDIDMTLFLPNKKARLGVDLIPEYRGPIDIGVEIKGKGRGVIAKDDLPSGTLFLACRAFEIIFDTEDEDDDLENGIAARMKLDPSLMPQVYKLHAGVKLGSSPQSRDIDLDRISGICTMNAFGNSKNSNGYGHNSRGLWVSASFFNHDCIDFNSVWKVLGDFIFVRTVKDVRAGEELTISYTDSAEHFEERQKFFAAHDFACACRLCRFHTSEKPEIRQKRLELITRLTHLDEHPTSDVKADILLAEKCLAELEKLGKGSPLPDFSPHVALDILCKLYGKNGDSKKCKEAAARYYAIVNPEGGPNLEVGAAGQVVGVFLKNGDLEEAKKWIKVLKRDLVTVYGKGDSAFPKLYPQMYAQAKKQGIV